MNVDQPLFAALAPKPVVFINLWPESGMKHYAESLVHALAPAVPVLYVRNYESSLSIKSLRVRLNPVRLSEWSELWHIARTVIKLRPSAIHLNSELPVLLPLFPLFACFNSVITLHDAVPHQGESLAKRLFMRFHQVFVFLFIRKIIVHSAIIRDQLPALLRGRTHVVPHINYRLWARDKSAERGPGPFSVLFFGRLLRYKGLKYLLEAFRLLDPEKFELVIAGEGDLAEYAIGGSNIRVLNRLIPDEEMAVLFSVADAVALPYTAASQSGVAYMAFAFEKPVIATRVGGIAEIVVDEFNGLLIEPKSADALAAAIRRLAEPDLRQRLIENVRRQNLSADEEIGARLLAIYRD
jgi:glycosyltransferase involved in cell wall biosynthesis